MNKGDKPFYSRVYKVFVYFSLNAIPFSSWDLCRKSIIYYFKFSSFYLIFNNLIVNSYLIIILPLLISPKLNLLYFYYIELFPFTRFLFNLSLKELCVMYGVKESRNMFICIVDFVLRRHV